MKLSAIMVKPATPLRMLVGIEREVVTWFLREFFQGIDAANHAAWLRVCRRWWKSDDVWTFYPVVNRHGRFHRMHMKVEGLIFQHQDAFVQPKAFTVWLKTGAVFGEFKASAGKLVFVPSSRKYEDCSDDEMREFHKDAIEFLHTPIALATLWPAMTEPQRLETLELLLKNPTEGEQP
jgi:hypothetical protein